MAYQNVSTPRFYCNVLEWEDSIGYRSIDSINRTLPVTPTNFVPLYYSEGAGQWNEQSFVAFLGHRLHGSNIFFVVDPGGTVSQADWTEPLVNAEGGAYSGYPFNGFSILGFNGEGVEYFGIVSATITPGVNTVGSLIAGTYYDMPQSANLSLSLSYEYDGVKKITTKGGYDLSYSKYTKPAMWDLGAWELDVEDPPEHQRLGRSGRRSWDLKFSFMDDAALWGPNQALETYTWGSILAEDGWDSEDLYESPNWSFNSTLLSDDNFFSQVWHKTNSGTLPFLFNPAGGGSNPNNNPDMFAICKFKNNSLKAPQSAFNVYDISLSIEEVW